MTEKGARLYREAMDSESSRAELQEEIADLRERFSLSQAEFVELTGVTLDDE